MTAICVIAMASVATAMMPRKTSAHGLTPRLAPAPADMPRVPDRWRWTAFRDPVRVPRVLLPPPPPRGRGPRAPSRPGSRACRGRWLARTTAPPPHRSPRPEGRREEYFPLRRFHLVPFSPPRPYRDL